jgi:hypothetical protein
MSSLLGFQKVFHCFKKGEMKIERGSTTTGRKERKVFHDLTPRKSPGFSRSA